MPSKYKRTINITPNEQHSFEMNNITMGTTFYTKCAFKLSPI